MINGDNRRIKTGKPGRAGARPAVDKISALIGFIMGPCRTSADPLVITGDRIAMPVYDRRGWRTEERTYSGY
jgi:hypothetical protein